jgi:ferredoxin, 2Fe-2S
MQFIANSVARKLGGDAMEKNETFCLESGRYGPFLRPFPQRIVRDSEGRSCSLPHPREALSAGVMASIHVTGRSGTTRTVEAVTGQSLKDALKGAGIDEILGLCGGVASCGTCHVHVAEAWLDRLPAMQADEQELLGFSDWRESNSRLACQVPFSEELDGISVTVAPED